MKELMIMGEKWTIKEVNPVTDPYMTGWNADGYCDHSGRMIVLADGFGEPLQDENRAKKGTLRHEIVHAFQFECGLSSNKSMDFEEMATWFAEKGSQIIQAWIDAGAIDVRFEEGKGFKCVS